MSVADHSEPGPQEERKRLSRELHDQLGQVLTGLKMDVAWLQRRLAGRPAAEADVRARLVEMSHYLDAAVADVRDIARWLRAAPDADVGATIDTQVRSMAARAGLQVYADICPDIPLSREAKGELLRIIQEAITNVIRHADARAVWICLQCTATEMELRIRDDGKGLPLTNASATSLGMTGMRERARRLGARFSVQTSPQGGTLVHLRRPLPDVRQQHSSISTQGKGA